MSYRNELDLIIKRMHLSENSEKYNELNICPSNLMGIKKELYDAVVEFRILTDELEECENDTTYNLPKKRRWHKLKEEIVELLELNDWK